MWSCRVPFVSLLCRLKLNTVHISWNGLVIFKTPLLSGWEAFQQRYRLNHIIHGRTPLGWAELMETIDSPLSDLLFVEIHALYLFYFSIRRLQAPSKISVKCRNQLNWVRGEIFHSGWNCAKFVGKMLESELGERAGRGSAGNTSRDKVATVQKQGWSQREWSTV